MTAPTSEAGALVTDPPRSRLSRLRDLASIEGEAMLAFAAMGAAGAIDILVLALELADGTAMRLFHQVTMVSVMVILVALVPCYRLLRSQADRQVILDTQIEELRRIKEAAEAANRLKARFLANVSHEIRSPLNAIYGYAQLVEQEADVPPRDAARIIRQCAEHMTALVESLLDHSRLENGLLRIRSEIVCLPEFIDQIASMMRPAAEAKGLTWVCELPAYTPEFVRTDQSRLRQALINMLTNAIKFTNRGSVTFRLRYRGEIAVFEIEDTGPGIAEEDRERIFDPYEQITGEGIPAPGVGLGLPITKAIIEIMGGKLEFESTPGYGSCFRATLMMGQATAAQLSDTISRRIVGCEGPARSVLVVDDDPYQRSFLARFLSGCGLEVIAVADGETAVSLCMVRRFDLTVLDISLPGISGWETASQLRELAIGDMAIVMASANAQEFQHPEHPRPAHDHFLVKPYRLDDMAETISALLKLSWRWEATGVTDPDAARGDRLPAKAHAHVERLLELIRIGHVRGIEAEVALLAEHAPGEGKLINALYVALDEFDLAGMAKLLEGK